MCSFVVTHAPYNVRFLTIGETGEEYIETLCTIFHNFFYKTVLTFKTCKFFLNLQKINKMYSGARQSGFSLGRALAP